MESILSFIKQAQEKWQKQFAVLVDPDNVSMESTLRLVRAAVESKVDYFFVGGSLMTESQLHETVKTIKSESDIPIILFPGSNMHISPDADGILFLSLISGRNPDLLIGQHVAAAPILKNAGLEILPTGYMLIDGGAPTTVSYISNTQPIPYDKPSIAACTALAGEMLGLQLIYLDAGSGAKMPVSEKMVSAVRKTVNAPILVGGGVRTPSKAQEIWEAGADLLIVGNGIEENLSLLNQIAERAQYLNQKSSFTA
jgi:putative glycerol-1-phosphate prenyltransferase